MQTVEFCIYGASGVVFTRENKNGRGAMLGKKHAGYRRGGAQEAAPGMPTRGAMEGPGGVPLQVSRSNVEPLLELLRRPCHLDVVPELDCATASSPADTTNHGLHQCRPALKLWRATKRGRWALRERHSPDVMPVGEPLGAVQLCGRSTTLDGRSAVSGERLVPLVSTNQAGDADISWAGSLDPPDVTVRRTVCHY